MTLLCATDLFAASWDYEASWYLKRPGEAPHAGHFLARSIEDARSGLSTALSQVDALTTGWAHIQDQIEDRIIAQYLGSPIDMIAEITGTHAAI